MLSCANDTTTRDAARAEIVASILSLVAQGATVAELVDGLEWARCWIHPEHDGLIAELVAELRAGRLVEVRS
jgi:hypothetical protein